MQAAGNRRAVGALVGAFGPGRVPWRGLRFRREVHKHAMLRFGNGRIGLLINSTTATMPLVLFHFQSGAQNI